MTWFKKDAEINWIDLSDSSIDAVEASIRMIKR
jgi:tRNA dimethylallyltransferase